MHPIHSFWYTDYCQVCAVKFDTFVGNLPLCPVCIVERGMPWLADEYGNPPESDGERITPDDYHHLKQRYEDLCDEIEAACEKFERGTITALELHQRIRAVHERYDKENDNA